MFCKKCGNELMDESVVCTKCGCAVDAAPIADKDGKWNSSSVLVIVFMFIGTMILSGAFFFIPLAWCVPMIMYYERKVRNGQKVGTAFKVCCLLFVSTVAGIIMLCDKD